MSHQTRHLLAPGPFRVDQIREGDPYELSNGHPIQCLPGGREHASHNLIGGSAIATDPDVEWAGVDAGYSLAPATLRAPDVAVGAPGPEQGWIAGTPALAVEYAGVGQDEDELQAKIAEFFAAGTRLVWVVRLGGPWRVEVHAKGKPMRQVSGTGILKAPGILRNPIPVAALYDRKAAHEVMLRNLLQGQGYAGLEAVRLEARVAGKAEGESIGRAKGKVEGEAIGRARGKAEGQAEALLAVLEGRGLPIAAADRTRILACTEADQLKAWLSWAGRVNTVADLFDAP